MKVSKNVLKKKFYDLQVKSYLVSCKIAYESLYFTWFELIFTLPFDIATSNCGVLQMTIHWCLFLDCQIFFFYTLYDSWKQLHIVNRLENKKISFISKAKHSITHWKQLHIVERLENKNMFSINKAKHSITQWAQPYPKVSRFNHSWLYITWWCFHTF